MSARAIAAVIANKGACRTRCTASTNQTSGSSQVIRGRCGNVPINTAA